MSFQGLYNGFYAFDKYKTKKDNLSPYKIGIKVSSYSSSKVSLLISNAKNLFAGVNLTRHLINEPPQIITPAALAAYARRISKGKNIKCSILLKKDIIKKKMLGIWDVGKGSVNDPRFIHLTYNSNNSSKKVKKIALIGKGVTYDTGGLSLKPADYMLSLIHI